MLAIASLLMTSALASTVFAESNLVLKTAQKLPRTGKLEREMETARYGIQYPTMAQDQYKYVFQEQYLYRVVDLPYHHS